MSSLAEEVQRFRQWAENHPERSGEWETDYPDWPRFLSAVDKVAANESLDDDQVDLVLYALARDNECQNVLGILEEHPRNGMRVARAAIESAEQDARWQVAVFLGSQEEDEARTLLRRFVGDADEYVRRRALLAAVAHDPAFAEEKAVVWLTAPNEYSRLAALSVLQETRSVRLEHALHLLRRDSSPYVRRKVAEIEKGGPT